MDWSVVINGGDREAVRVPMPMSYYQSFSADGSEEMPPTKRSLNRLVRNYISFWRD